MVFFVSNFAANGKGGHKESRLIYLDRICLKQGIRQRPWAVGRGLCEKSWASQMNNTTKTN